jgi:serine/threonine-protein kinase
LQRGDYARAIGRLRRAISLRAEPGRNVVTYGTNVEARYYPYLHLADACLALGDLEGARRALESSASWNREPAEQRLKLLARLEAATAPQRSPPPATTMPTPAVSAPVPEPPAVPIASPSPPPPLPSLVPEPARQGASATPPPPGAPGPRTTPVPRVEASPAGAAPPTGTLAILSTPPGAAAYVDDDPIGSTDPQSGRIVKSGVAAGRHHVRLSLPGYLDAVGEIDVAPGGGATFHATLREAGAFSDRGALLGFVLVALALVGVLAWMALRRPGGGPVSAPATPRPPTTDPGDRADTRPGLVSPGVRRDEHGQEWFGDYRLLELLGRGGMASVYRAERRGEQVALKRPLGSLLDDPEFLQRFTREAEISRSMNHPNIVRILERGVVSLVPYYTMELLAGQTLSALIRSQGASAPRAAATVVAQVAEALDYAHSKGVVHRDLKPSNIMLLPDGTAKVMDFGIARARRFEGLTATGAFLGTPEYVAPETIEGHGTDARSDLYSLGVVFYELLTGRTPFRAEAAFAILRQHCTEEPAPPSRLEKGVPSELEAIVLRLLRKSPEERTAHAEELVVALREWLGRAA